MVIYYFRSATEAIQKQNVDNQEYIELVSISDDFILETLESQKLFNEYMLTWKKGYVESYKKSVAKMDSIIAFTQNHPQLKKQNDFFLQVKELLDEQYKLVPKLKKRLYAQNPVDKVAKDSLFNKDLDLAVGRASLSYDINIRSLRYEIVSIMRLNNDISDKISKLLLDIFENTSHRSMKSMDEALLMAESNNRYTLLIGLSTIGLIIILSAIILINVFKIKRTKEALQKANKEKEELIANRHRLLLSVTHDVKTPLSSIKAYLSSSEISLQERRIMLDSTLHVISLMDNLLDFSTMQKGQISLNMSNFNLQDLCDSSVDMFNSLAREKGLVLLKEYQSDCDVRVNSDALKIKQILINLISNALKYTIKGSVKIYISLEREPEYVLKLSVEDTGVGVSQEQISKIFKPYYRSDDNMHLSNGTGLGLYVVEGFTKLLGGELNMESQRGKGTIVSLILPIGQYLPNHASESAKRILVIEDEPGFRTVVKMLLSRLSHEVITASGLVKGDFDYVLSDLNLPNITRAEILNEYKEIPVVLMTADTTFPSEKAMNEGFMNIIYKPFSIEDLQEIFGGSIVENDSIEMLGDDTTQMDSVVETFMDSLPSYLKDLEDSLEKDDILAARFVSHKMLPMFVLFRSGEMIPILNRLNSVGADGARSYLNWRFDVESLIKMIYSQYY